jgi:protein-histidine pros-kinase
MAEAEQTIQTFVSALSGVVLTLILLLNLMLNFIVIRPVKTLSKQADEVSMGALNVEELPVKSKDEISSLTRSINRMHRSLSNALKMLEEND